MDNIGNYATYDEMILQLKIADDEKVIVSDITLSSKVVDPAGDKYTFAVAGGDPSPKIGDVIAQGGETAIIIALPTGSTIQINKTGAENPILESLSDLLHSDKVPRKVGEDFILEAMDTIDKATGQFFNKRTFDDTNPVTIEGNNTPTLFFSVPIIVIDKLLVNSTGVQLVEGEDDDFIAFKSRSHPRDDRENPMIKLNVGRGRDSIFHTPSTTRLFIRRTLTTIEGSFGYLEPNGSTPRLITRATLLLAIDKTANPLGGTNSFEITGPLKRRKLDIHETEFFTLNDKSNIGRMTDIPEVDRILTKYRSPIKIGGSFPLLPGGRDFNRHGRSTING